MKRYFKEFLLKCLIVIIIVLAVLPLFLILCSELFDFKLSTTAIFLPLIAMFVLGVIFIILLPTFGMAKASKNTDKVSINYKNFVYLKKVLFERLKEKNYKLYETNLNINTGELCVFYQKRFWNIPVFVLAYTDELTDSFLSELNDIFKKSLTEIGGKIDRISLSSLICVNRVSPTFYKFLDDMASTSIREIELRAGYSFGGKTLYVAEPKIDVGLVERKKMKKLLFEILPNQSDSTENGIMCD